MCYLLPPKCRVPSPEAPRMFWSDCGPCVSCCGGFPACGGGGFPACGQGAPHVSLRVDHNSGLYAPTTSFFRKIGSIGGTASTVMSFALNSSRNHQSSPTISKNIFSVYFAKQRPSPNHAGTDRWNLLCLFLLS